MKPGDWVETPDGPGVLEHIQPGKRWYGRRSYPEPLLYFRFPGGRRHVWTADRVGAVITKGAASAAHRAQGEGIEAVEDRQQADGKDKGQLNLEEQGAQVGQHSRSEGEVMSETQPQPDPQPEPSQPEPEPEQPAPDEGAEEDDGKDQ